VSWRSSVETPNMRAVQRSQPVGVQLTHYGKQVLLLLVRGYPSHKQLCPSFELHTTQ